MTTDRPQEPTPASDLPAETIAGLSEQLLSLRLPDADLRAVTDLLNAIRTESREMRQFEIGDTEPATLYTIGER